ncbi:ANKRD19P [Symbiodinium sp. CCMP2592]|nr:ANKRD19P [Symbiodinium sp. CCMP2592]
MASLSPSPSPVLRALCAHNNPVPSNPRRASEAARPLGGRKAVPLLGVCACAVSRTQRQVQRSWHRNAGKVVRAASEPKADELRELWQKAYQLEVERSEGLKGSDSPALPAAPGENATAEEWQKAYEAMKAANADLERAKRELLAAESEDSSESAEADGPKVPDPVPTRASQRLGSLAPDAEASEESGKVLSIFDLAAVDVDSQQLADVTRFRDALGPGTLPLLKTLFDKESAEVLEVGELREALQMAGSGFTVTSNLSLGRCLVLRGLLARDVGGRGTLQQFLEDRQAALDQRYGSGNLTVFLQRERPPPAPGLSLWPKGQFDPVKVWSPSDKELPAALLVFRTSDLPIPSGKDSFRRFAVGASFVATLVFCNIISAAVGFLEGQGSDILVGRSVEEVTYSPLLGVAVTRLDPDGVGPVGVGLVLMLFAQGLGRGLVADQFGVEVQGGYFIPSSALGTVGRTWTIKGLAPSRKVQIQVALGGIYAGFAAALLLCLVGILMGDASDGLLKVDVTRLPLLLAQLLGDSFPADAAQTVLGLGSGEAAPSVPARVPLDPLLFSGCLALTTQAVRLLPLRGLDGHLLARFLFGPRPIQLLELGTGVVLLLGAVGRLGPNANAAVCSSALFAWGVSFLAATRESPLPPREDFDDEPAASPQLAALAVLALFIAALVLRSLAIQVDGIAVDSPGEFDLRLFAVVALALKGYRRPMASCGILAELEDRVCRLELELQCGRLSGRAAEEEGILILHAADSLILTEWEQLRRRSLARKVNNLRLEVDAWISSPQSPRTTATASSKDLGGVYRIRWSPVELARQRHAVQQPARLDVQLDLDVSPSRSSSAWGCGAGKRVHWDTGALSRSQSHGSLVVDAGRQQNTPCSASAWENDKAPTGIGRKILAAAVQGDVMEVQNLLCFATEEEKELALMTAVRYGRAEVCVLLLKGCISLRSPGGLGRLALASACLYGHRHVARCLLEHGAPPEQRDEYGRTALHLACTSSAEIVRDLLCFSPALTFLKDKQGRNALFHAMGNNKEEEKLEIVRLLLEMKCSATEVDCFGRSALHYAVQKGDMRVVTLLQRTVDQANEEAMRAEARRVQEFLASADAARAEQAAAEAAKVAARAAELRAAEEARAALRAAEDRRSIKAAEAAEAAAKMREERLKREAAEAAEAVARAGEERKKREAVEAAMQAARSEEERKKREIAEAVEAAVKVEAERRKKEAAAAAEAAAQEQHKAAEVAEAAARIEEERRKKEATEAAEAAAKLEEERRQQESQQAAELSLRVERERKSREAAEAEEAAARQKREAAEAAEAAARTEEERQKKEAAAAAEAAARAQEERKQRDAQLAEEFSLRVEREQRSQEAAEAAAAAAREQREAAEAAEAAAKAEEERRKKEAADAAEAAAKIEEERRQREVESAAEFSLRVEHEQHRREAAQAAEAAATQEAELKSREAADAAAICYEERMKRATAEAAVVVAEDCQTRLTNASAWKVGFSITVAE